MTQTEWVQEHFYEFVMNHLGYIPQVEVNSKIRVYPLSVWTPRHTKALLAVWNQAKINAKGRQILLAGRDVFLFEVLARLEDFPTIFRPDISGPVARAKGAVTEDYRECFLLDTGFSGSVPKALGMKNFNLISYNPHGTKTTAEERSQHQVFPNAFREKYNKNGALVGAPSIILQLAGFLEGVPKYWSQATFDPKKGQIIQTLWSPTSTYPGANSQFVNAATMTRYLVEAVTGVSVESMPRRRYVPRSVWLP